MDNPNITMKEYISLKEEKSHRRVVLKFVAGLRFSDDYSMLLVRAQAEKIYLEWDPTEFTKARNESVKSDKQADKPKMETINTVRINGVNTAGQTSVSSVEGNEVTVVKTSTGYVWRPKIIDLNNVSKDSSGSWISNRVKLIDPQGRLKETLFEVILQRLLKMTTHVLLDKRESNTQPLAEAVNTACYVLNRVLVTKPHNKKPYELIIGRPPSISFMRPFGCHVTIFNTLDPLGKFDGKAEEGFLVGYFVNNKAFRSSDDNARDNTANDAARNEKVQEPAMGTKWVYQNTKDERGIVVRNKARLVAQGHKQEESIDYDEVFALVAKVEAIRLFLDFASYMNFPVYHMDVKSAFLYRIIEEEVYVSQPPGFMDLEFLKKVYKVEKALYGLHQAPIAWSFIYLTSSRPDIMFSVRACSRFQVQPKVSHLHAVKRIFRYLKGQPKLGLWYPKDSLLILEAFLTVTMRVPAWTGNPQHHVVNFLKMDYGYNFMHTKIHVDNESAIYVIKNPVYHSKTKHIEIRHHFIRDSYEKRLIEMVKILTDNNVADLLTKVFDVTRFNFLVASIVKTSKARRKARIVISEDEDADDPSKQGRSLIEELGMDVSGQPEDQLGVFSAAKVFADVAKQGRSVGNAQTYTRQRRRVNTASTLVSIVDVNTASEMVNTAGLKARDKARKLHEEELTRFNAKQEAIDIARKENFIANGDQAHDIDWSDPAVIRYHTLQNRPRSVAEKFRDQKEQFKKLRDNLQKKKRERKVMTVASQQERKHLLGKEQVEMIDNKV
nr:copia protein [Tanacetum cinerariifolium]